LIATILSGLAMHNRSLEAFELFDDFCSNSNAHNLPNIDCFAMMLKICAYSHDWQRCKEYFVLMTREWKIRPNSLCFKYLLSTTAYCRPPRYEEAMSILFEMKTQWKISPNSAHFGAVIHCLATRYNLIKHPLSERCHNFNKYKFKLLHSRLFDESDNVLSDFDLQKILNLFDQMIEEYEVVPNDKVFGELFYAMSNAKNLKMARKYLKFWRTEYPQVRQQSFSFMKLLSICSRIQSWDDAMSIYEQIALPLSIDDVNCFFHKVQPEIGCFNQLLRCNKLDISRQIFENGMSASEAEKLCLQRLEFVQSQMFHFKYSPNEFSWLLLFTPSKML